MPRLVAALLLAIGIVAADRLWPPREPSWSAISEPLLDQAGCRSTYPLRESCRFTLPRSPPEPVTWAQAAEWFRLEQQDVCSTNNVDASRCAEQQLQPGDALTLPLRHHRRGPPGRAPAEQPP